MIQQTTIQNGYYSNREAIAIIIPSLNPDEKLKDLVHAIQKEISEMIPIVLVDDGSDSTTKPIFSDLSSYKNTHILTHLVNKGKGMALRTAFAFMIENLPTYTGVITVDGDGQHSPSDIVKCIKAFELDNQSVVLGSRHFDKKKVPLRSRFGNILTRKIIKGMNGLELKDTQTGLRVIPTYILKELVDVPGDRYEYELNMLLYFKQQDIPIKEVTIETIYLNDNESSHFNPLIDSIKIYAVFLKYIFSSAASFIVDISLFALFVYFFEGWLPGYYIILATILSRILSACFNYLVNKYLVFKEKKSSLAFFRYGILFLLEMSASALFVNMTVALTTFNSEWLVKVLIDSLIFCAGYYIQKNWVFKKEKLVENT